MTMRPLPRPVAPVEQYLAAVVDRLDQLNATLAELNGRLGSAAQPPAADPEEGTVRLLEPDRPAAVAQLREPDTPEPPRHGKGSGRDVWAAHADRLGVSYPPEAGQRVIIAAVEIARRAA